MKQFILTLPGKSAEGKVGQAVGKAKALQRPKGGAQIGRAQIGRAGNDDRRPERSSAKAEAAVAQEAEKLMQWRVKQAAQA